MKNKMLKLLCICLAATLMLTAFAGCGEKAEDTSNAEETTVAADSTVSNEDIIKKAAAAGKVGNWGLGNQYEVQALLQKYGQPTDCLTEDFTMDGIDSDEIWLASAMTYNELGLIKNDYEGGYSYGNEIAVIDMNDEGVAMLEDNLFCTKEFAEKNPNTVKAFIAASMKGWKNAECLRTKGINTLCKVN